MTPKTKRVVFRLDVKDRKKFNIWLKDKHFSGQYVLERLVRELLAGKIKI